MLANLTQLLGAAVVIYGLTLVWLPVAIIAAGAVVFTIGLTLEAAEPDKAQAVE